MLIETKQKLIALTRAGLSPYIDPDLEINELYDSLRNGRLYASCYSAENRIQCPYWQIWCLFKKIVQVQQKIHVNREINCYRMIFYTIPCCKLIECEQERSRTKILYRSYGHEDDLGAK